eukprot:TRINITY_DN94336_c0_g1_i1.p1 TRINITY_DN94336_c0_g1~~TRINITY_DN94336_c0_g1_i1.p1  ORF type:complete len:382 (-),score=5.73 TRINITY_DN94336_c0_g1_i1:150-1295(-)
MEVQNSPSLTPLAAPTVLNAHVSIRHPTPPPKTPPLAPQDGCYGVVSAYKVGGDVIRQSVGYGSGNEVFLHEENLDQTTSCSESESASASASDANSRRIRLTRITPRNVEGERPRRVAGNREYSVDNKINRMRKAGERKKRRWMNDHFIDEGYSKNLPTDLEEAKREWLTAFIPDYNSAFTEVLEDDYARRKFAPFVNITEEKQNQLLAARTKCKNERKRAQSYPPAGGMGGSCDSAERYQSITPELRRASRKAYHAKSLGPIEKKITTYLDQSPSTETPPLELRLGSGFNRMVCHAVCQYYCLKSKSFDDIDEGERVTHVSVNKNGLHLLPDIPLAVFFQRAYQQHAYLSDFTVSAPPRNKKKVFRKHTSGKPKNEQPAS